jgi:hypothetical protein
MTTRKPAPDDIVEANQAVSRGKGPKRKGRGSHRLSVAVPPAQLVQADNHEAGETEAALRRATNTSRRRD